MFDFIKFLLGNTTCRKCVYRRFWGLFCGKKVRFTVAFLGGARYLVLCIKLIADRRSLSLDDRYKHASIAFATPRAFHQHGERGSRAHLSGKKPTGAG